MKSINNYYETGIGSHSKNDSNVLEIFHALISNQNTTNDGKKRLSLLNSITKLLLLSSDNNLLTTEEFLYCLSSNFVHQLTQVRAGALRVSRYLLRTTNDLQTFNNLQLPYFVCRSLDILLKNEEERIQALKLIRRIILISPNLISPCLVRCLVALGDTSMIDGAKPDRIVRACLATLSELGVLNPSLFIVCNGVAVLTRNVLECDSPRIAESLVGVLLHLLEYPSTRNMAGISLDCLAAPYCDFSYRLGIMDKNKDARDLRFKCSRLSLLSVLRSWAGTLEFCSPGRASGLKAIIDILYLNQLEVRKAILDLMYELLGLPQPAWTDEFAVALAAVDPSDYQDSWRLTEGFVAMEGRSVLPSLACKVPNICEIHQAFLVYCFIENGFLNALVEVIVSSDTFISVRATILLAKLLQMIHTMLPPDVCSSSPSLPTLIAKATEGNHQAQAAIAALQTYHQIMRNRPAACSLYLDAIIQNGGLINSRLFKREIDAQQSLSKSASMSLYERIRSDSIGSTDASGTFWDYWDLAASKDATSLGEGTETIKDRSKKSSILRQRFLGFFEKFRENERLIKESMVLTNIDSKAWEWDIIVTIFRNKSLSTKLDENQLKFIRTLTQYFKPSSNKFSHMELGISRLLPPNVNAGIELIDYLLEQSDELEYMRILTDFCSDVSVHLQAICKKKPHDCLFSPSHMNTTMCQQYFLFIGRVCRSVKGCTILKNTDILKHLMYLVANTNHTIYVKLIVSGLDYSLTSHVHYPRLILEKALTTSPSQSSRLYATQFLLVLLRARLPTVEEWGIPLLLKQLADKDRAIMLAALDILEEACHENVYLLELAHVWPDLETYHELGKYIMMRFYSIPRGMNHPSANVKSEIEIWVKVYNKKYVLFVESETHSSLTLHSKNEEGYYSTRNSLHQRQTISSTNLPYHLYGALVQTQRGISYLQKHGNVSELLDILSAGKCGNEEECLNLKSALWALGHVATNSDGVDFLNDSVSRVFEKIIRFTKFCEVYSVRETAFHVLCLISSSVAGANALFKLDWITVRHDRNNEFPILEPEDWYLKNPSPVRYNYNVPAYNYATIDENVMNLTSSSFNPSLNVEGSSNQSKDDLVHEESMNVSTSTQRSRTLPAGTLPSQMHQRSSAKHFRSLSESKTVDGITGMVMNRTRFNSGDSNTSGVSSCDSVNMRTVINERFRRVSLSGTPITTGSSHLTDQDVHGYKKLRQIRRNLRPMLSESAADDLADIFENEGNGKPSGRTLLTSFTLDSKRKLHSRNIERQQINLSGIDDIQKNIYVAKLLTQVDTKGPCYRGICLPRNILDLFPEQSQSGTYVSRYIQEFETLESNNLSASSILIKNQFTQEVDVVEHQTGARDESVVSEELSEISLSHRRSRRKTATETIEAAATPSLTSSVATFANHNRNDCLICCRTKVINRILDTTNLLIQESKDSTSQNGKSRDTDVSFYSPESIVSDDSANINMPDRISNTILRNVKKMANPIMFKACRKVLMELKQKYPQSFQDICLYSEVCKYMSLCSYRMTVRRFIQEIFLDLNFEALGNSAEMVLEIAQQRLSDINLLNTSKLLPLSPPSTSTAPYPPQPLVLMQTHKLHSLKSPLLASVVETSVENLVDTSSKVMKDEVDAVVTLRSPEKSKLSPGGSTQVTAEVHNTQNQSRKSMDMGEASFEPLRRRRFNTLELDLSCTKNKFPIKHRSPTLSSGPSATSTLRRPVSLNVNKEQQQPLLKSNISMSDHSMSFESSSRKMISSPVSTPLGTLFCEQRLLTSSRSEATLSNKRCDIKKGEDETN